ncbi:carbohydrate kinase family protein [Umezawaea tangerina]|uniref:Sugar/nucleoside kinase (Ribokinase family) n=1 Tax=Umezawaea tangerina TaxID=84725 RepID=A0A2T0T6N6_9PSEU|nr:carbohydrate kinase family protein [Umezawaea tangerina]PRY41305.1 sugar/nucleoside kinase (ribokinase family) [Umezawaea tangerina]
MVGSDVEHVSPPPALLSIGVVSADRFLRVGSLPRPEEKVNGKDLGWFVGGMCANFSVAARQFGARTRFMTVFGDDEQSARIQDGLTRLGVDLQGSVTLGNRSSWSSLTLLSDQGEKVLVILESDLPLPASENCVPHLSEGWDVVYPVSIDAAWCTEIGVVAQSHGALVAYDLEPYFVESAWGTRQFAEMMSCGDLVFTKMDAIRVAGFDTKADAAAALMDLGPRLVVITDGPRPVYCAGAGRTMSATPPSVQVVDSTGAGDGFAGAFCGLYAQGRPLEDCLSVATAVGTLCVTSLGCQSYAPIEWSAFDAMHNRVMFADL